MYLSPRTQKEDPEEDPADYPVDGGDDVDDESSDDDDEEEEQEASEDDDEEEEEHLAPTDSSTVPIVDPVSSAEDTEAFETDESAPTPVPSPRCRTARMSIRPPTPMSATAEALIAEVAGIRLRAASPSTHHPSEIPSPPLLLPSTSHRNDLPEADMPLRKRARFTTPTGRFEVGESSSAAAAARQIASTTAEGLSQRVIDLSTTLARDTHEIHVRLEDAHDDRALQRGQVNMLFRDRRFHRHTAMLLESDARHAREAWSHSMNCSKVVHETLVVTLVAQTSSLQTQLTTALGCIQTLDAREPARTDDPEDAGSSELFTHKEEMDLDSAQTTTTAKLPILKQENVNSFKPAAQTTTNADGTSTSLIPGLVTTEGKVQKKNDVKERSMLLMALPNEHLMTFNQYKDAKTLFAAIQTRFGESLDSIFNRLQKIVSQLAILGENISQEDLNLKFLRKDLGTKIAGTGIKTALKTVNVEETSSKPMVAIDGVGFGWSYMADDKVPTNMALMAFSDSKVHNDKSCSKICLKSFETLKTQLDDLRIEFNKSEFNLATYKKGLASVEEQLDFYKKNEVIFCEQLAVLKRDISYKDSEISMLKSELEKLNQEKESNQLKIENFDNAFKSLDKLIGSQITDKSRKGVGFVSYNVVPPPHTGLFSPPNLDLSYSGLEEFQQPEFEGYGPKTNNSVSATFHFRKPVKYAEMYMSQTPKGNQRNWNNQKSQQLGSDFVMYNKACFVCGSFDHVQANCNYHQRERVVSGNNYTRVNYNYSIKKAHPSAHRNMAPRAVLMKTGIRTLNTARPINTAHPKTIVYSARSMSHFSKSAQSTGHPQKEDQGYVDSGCSSHMTGNMSYLSDFKEFDRGYMCDKKNSVLFTNTGCFVLSPNFKLVDESQVLLKVPRKNNMYNVDIKNIVPKESLTCLVAKATLDESMIWHRRFTWVFFLASKDETSGILKSFITQIENLVDKKVKIIRCDNGTEFKNRVMSEFYEKKGIKREFSIARTPQQNGVAERRNRTLIEAARTMLADSKLPTIFWAEAVNTACYVQNRVLVVKPHNKTPYELFRGRTPSLSFMRPFGCHVTILNTLDHLGKFDGKSDDGFFVGYSLNSKAFRVYNIRTRKVEENLHVRFLEDKPIIAGDGPKWLFDIDVLTKSMNYVPVVAGTNSNDFVGTKESIGAGHSSKEPGSSQDYILMPLWKDGSLFDSSPKNTSNDEPQPSSDAGKKDDDGGIDNQEGPENSSQDVNTAGPSINTASTNINTGSLNINIVSPSVTTAPLEATHADFFGDETELDMSNITNTYLVPTTPSTRIHKDHSLDHVIGNVQSGVQTRRMTRSTNEQGFISTVYEGKTHEDLQNCLFACFLSQVEPKKVIQALTDSSWIEAMQDELLQFKLQKVWTLVDLPYGKRAIGTKWVYRNKKDERGIVIRNKARLMDVKSAFLYGKIEEEVYVCQPLGFEDPDVPLNKTATVRTVDNREQEITATVDGKEFTITEASVRRHLQLADVDEDGEGSGIPLIPQTTTFYCSTTNEEPIPNVVSSSHQKTQTPRQALNKVTELPQTSEPIPNVPDEAVYEEWDDRVERATTTAASLDAEQASGGSPRCQEAMGGSIAQTRSERVPTPPRDSPLPRVHTLGSDEGSMTLQELTVLCTTLSKKVESLEADLKQTKQVYGAAYTKLIMKVKKLEKTVKTSHSRRRAKIVVSDDEEDSEDSSKQGRMIEEIISRCKSYFVVVKVKRLQEVLDDEEDKGWARVMKRSIFTKEEGKNIRASVKADEELSKRLQAEERNKYSEVDQAKMLLDLINKRKKYFAAQKVEAKRNKPMTQAQQRNYMIIYIKYMGSHTL
ncbi:ribonuclease H-like domain-containing protein [Tanacetum coccineum]